LIRPQRLMKDVEWIFGEKFTARHFLRFNRRTGRSDVSRRRGFSGRAYTANQGKKQHRQEARVDCHLHTMRGGGSYREA
ncbi:MAG: hypothetical protein ACREAC_05520, partial [Blastocatellia bacterium]